MTTAPDPQTFDPKWHWEPQPKAQALVDELIAGFLDELPEADHLARRMRDETGTRFKDWVDAIFVRAEAALVERLEAVGYRIDEDCALGDDHAACYRNPLGMFPPVVVLREGAPGEIHVSIKVERVADAMARLGTAGEHHLHGEPLGRYRVARLFGDDRVALHAAERHGWSQFSIPHDLPEKRVASARHLERLRTRRRDFGVGPGADEKGFDELDRLADEAVAEIGRDWACDLFFQAERDYWMVRNTAGRVQHARQNALGLGWANHDHHTYRCSRTFYTRTIGVLEKLGFYCREKFYAGAEAGWGAQVLEQDVTGIQIFADVDMAPEEIAGDFPHAGFGPKDDFGTVGLWVALHGEAMLQAGMHHLEAQFDWHALAEQLDAQAGIGMMDPFTAFPYLRQAFTEGETWLVPEERVEPLVEGGHITREQADRFVSRGAVGSHLENLERNDGFKGFNQQGVSDIISRTDARRVQPSGA